MKVEGENECHQNLWVLNSQASVLLNTAAEHRAGQHTRDSRTLHKHKCASVYTHRVHEHTLTLSVTTRALGFRTDGPDDT